MRAAVDCREMDRGLWGRRFGGKCLWRKAWQPWKQVDTAESHAGGGAITIASLLPHASISRWTVEWLAHQRPDTLEYRIRPHPGAPLSAWHTSLQSRTPARGPLCAWCTKLQRRTPGKGASKCLNGWGYGERLAKEAFRSPATRGSKEVW